MFRSHEGFKNMFYDKLLSSSRIRKWDITCLQWIIETSRHALYHPSDGVVIAMLKSFRNARNKVSGHPEEDGVQYKEFYEALTSVVAFFERVDTDYSGFKVEGLFCTENFKLKLADQFKQKQMMKKDKWLRSLEYWLDDHVPSKHQFVSTHVTSGNSARSRPSHYYRDAGAAAATAFFGIGFSIKCGEYSLEVKDVPESDTIIFGNRSLMKALLDNSQWKQDIHRALFGLDEPFLKNADQCIVKFNPISWKWELSVPPSPGSHMYFKSSSTGVIVKLLRGAPVVRLEIGNIFILGNHEIVVSQCSIRYF
jgi:hypothetical protein